MKTLVVLAFLAVGCVGELDDPTAMGGVGGMTVATAGTGGRGLREYVRDPAPTCDGEGAYTGGARCGLPGYWINSSGSYCVVCTFESGAGATGCAVRKEDLGSAADRDVFCVDSQAGCGVCSTWGN